MALLFPSVLTKENMLKIVYHLHFKTCFSPIHKFWKRIHFEHFYTLSDPRGEVFGKF